MEGGRNGVRQPTVVEGLGVEADVKNDPLTLGRS